MFVWWSVSVSHHLCSCPVPSTSADGSVGSGCDSLHISLMNLMFNDHWISIVMLLMPHSYWPARVILFVTHKNRSPIRYFFVFFFFSAQKTATITHSVPLLELWLTLIDPPPWQLVNSHTYADDAMTTPHGDMSESLLQFFQSVGWDATRFYLSSLTWWHHERQKQNV